MRSAIEQEGDSLRVVVSWRLVQPRGPELAESTRVEVGISDGAESQVATVPAERALRHPPHPRTFAGADGVGLLLRRRDDPWASRPRELHPVAIRPPRRGPVAGRLGTGPGQQAARGRHAQGVPDRGPARRDPGGPRRRAPAAPRGSASIRVTSVWITVNQPGDPGVHRPERQAHRRPVLRLRRSGRRPAGEDRSARRRWTTATSSSAAGPRNAPPEASHFCHPERSEGDHAGHGPLRCAQGDNRPLVGYHKVT